MPLKPWYKVVTPREDLREGKPLDASEFAVHLDQVREGSAPADYQKPERFFERTYLTKNLASLASGVIRRLSGEKTETNAIFTPDNRRAPDRPRPPSATRRYSRLQICGTNPRRAVWRGFVRRA
jgi:hypothetical protein